MKKRFKNKLNIFLLTLTIFILSVSLIFGISAFTSGTTGSSAYNVASSDYEYKSYGADKNNKDFSPNKIISSNVKLKNSVKKIDSEELVLGITNVVNEYSSEIKRDAARKEAQAATEAKGNSNTGTAVVSQDTSAPAETQNQAINLNNLESQILFLINTIRAQNGLGTLTPNQMLTDIARSRSQDMIARNYFSHHTPDGKNIKHIFAEFGVTYRNFGENLARSNPASHGTPEALINAWMNSPSHRDNMLKTHYRLIGIGVIDGGGKRVVTTLFIN